MRHREGLCIFRHMTLRGLQAAFLHRIVDSNGCQRQEGPIWSGKRRTKYNMEEEQ